MYANTGRSFRWLNTLVMTAILPLLITSAALADGLLYQLPADATSVKYDMKLKSERNPESDTTGSLTMSCVGEDEVDGQACRWIEVKLIVNAGAGAQTIISKVLIPTKSLKRGENPWANFKKAWLKMGDREAKEITEVAGNDAGPMPAFLAGPLQEEKMLEAADVESGLGKLSCAGVTGKVTIDDGKQKVNIEFENRLHDKAPFGVVTAKMSFRVEGDGESRESGVIELKLAEVGTKAKSELPDLGK